MAIHGTLVAVFALGNGTGSFAEDDVQVISKCMGAKIQEIAESLAGEKRPGDVFLGHPKEQSRGFTSENQVRAEFWKESTEVSQRVLELLPSTRHREEAGWNIPYGVTVEGFRVVYEEPPRENRFFVTETSFKFWAPGYARGGQEVLVRGLFTPSSHGASITCLLEKHSSGWRLVNVWLKYYA